jgi:two-component system, OmpR family, sensor kinase
VRISLRARLLVAATVASLVALVLVDVVTYLSVSAAQVGQVDDALQRSHEPIEELALRGTPAALATIASIAPGTYVAVLDDNGSATFVSPIARPGDAPETVDLHALLGVVGGVDGLASHRLLTVGTDDDEIRLRVAPLHGPGILVTGQSLREINQTRSRLLAVLIVATGTAMMVVAGLGWWLVRLGLRPLARIEAEARLVTDRALGQRRVSGAENPTEVGRLATTLNAMLDRLDAAREDRERTLAEVEASETRLRRFVADASHELRTPVAATAAYAELFDQGARLRPDDLERAMAGIRRETARMASLVDDLLTLARLDEPESSRHLSVDLTEVLLASVDAAKTIAPERALRLRIDGVVWVTGEPVQLRQVVDNLLANVRAHTPPSTVCDVHLSADHDEAVLEVADDGPGLAAVELKHVFDRFFRSDPARSRATGGSGLGLAIVHAIVDAHRGSITVAGRDPHGLVVTVRLPVRSRSAGESAEDQPVEGQPAAERPLTERPLTERPLTEEPLTEETSIELGAESP